MNVCYRIYNNLDKSKPLDLEDLEVLAWMTFNRNYRWGCAQIVNGKVVYRGYLEASRLITIDPTVTDTVPGFTNN